MDVGPLLSTCPDCKGAGKDRSIGGGKIVCETCGGTGKVDYRTADDDLQAKIALQYAS